MGKTMCFAAVVLLLTGTYAVAHHAFAAEYDANKRVTISGTVTAFKWTNPHAWLYIDEKGEGGKVTSWSFELGSPNALMRRGWSARSLKPGDQVTVNGYLAKDGSSLANARSITLSDGHELFAGSSDESPAGR